VRGTFQFTTDARVLNMSLDGMSIETSNPLKVGRVYALKLEEDGTGLPLRGCVVWCSLVRTTRDEKGDIRPVYRAGIHFEDLLTTRARDLRDFIRHNAVISLENRLFGRFRIEADASADLSFEADFLVRQLSSAGMLVETDVAPPVDSQCQIDIRLAEVQFSTVSRIVRVEHIEREEKGRGHQADDDEGAPIVHVGIEFLSMDDKSRQVLQGFIDTELS
jgi:hypothetical protein